MKSEHKAATPPRILHQRRKDQLSMTWEREKLDEKIKEAIPCWTTQTVCACCGKKIFQDTPIIWSRDHPGGRVWHVGRELRDPFAEDNADANEEYNECLAKFIESCKGDRKLTLEDYKGDALMFPPRLPHEIVKRRKERKLAAQRKLQEPRETKTQTE